MANCSAAKLVNPLSNLRLIGPMLERFMATNRAFAKLVRVARNSEMAQARFITHERDEPPYNGFFGFRAPSKVYIEPSVRFVNRREDYARKIHL